MSGASQSEITDSSFVVNALALKINSEKCFLSQKDYLHCCHNYKYYHQRSAKLFSVYN